MPTRSAVSHFFTARAQWLVWLCALGALTAPLSRVLPADHTPLLQWLVELAAHWQWLYATVGAVALGALLALRRAWPLVLPALVLAECFLWQSATLPRAAAMPADAPVLTVGTANLNLPPPTSTRWRNGWHRPTRPMWWCYRNTPPWLMRR